MTKNGGSLLAAASSDCRERSDTVILEKVLVRAAGDAITAATRLGQGDKLDGPSNALVNKGFRAMIGEDNNPDRFDVLEAIGYWRSWIESQAQLLWMYKGAPWDQGSTAQMDDFMRAKRYFAYLIADHIMSTCIAQKVNICPLSMLSASCARYLQSITIHQFAKFRGYFRYLERGPGTSSTTDVADADYLEAIDYIDRAFNANCEQSRQTGCVVWTKPPDRSEQGRIKEAKHRIVRLIEPDPILEADISTYVGSFYDWLIAGIPDSEDHSVRQRLLRDLYSATRIVNLFELVVKCFLARSIDAQSHNQLRTELKKPPILTRLP